jgi:hypothetical protein
MCSKFCGLSQLRNTTLHAVLRRAACRAACIAACLFNVVFSFHPLSELIPQKRTQCVLAAQRCAALLAAMFAAFSVIVPEFCCPSKTQVIAEDGLLHIQTAHPKRKCNRPLSTRGFSDIV